MTPKSLFRLAIQICGLYIIYLVIAGLPQTILGLFYIGRDSVYRGSLLMPFEIAIFLVPLIVGLILIFHAKRITGHFIREDDGLLVSVRKEDIIEVVTVIVGILRIVTSLPDSRLAIITFSSDNPTLIIIGIRIVVGAVLIWKARAISRYIMKINAVNHD